MVQGTSSRDVHLCSAPRQGLALPLQPRHFLPGCVPQGQGMDTQISRFTELWLAGLFAIISGVCIFNAEGVPLLEFAIAPFSTEISQQARSAPWRRAGV
jgi:hypothetical protein